MIFRIILFVLLFYFVYRLVFDLLIPVYRATRQVRKGFNDFQNHMNEQMRGKEGNGDQQGKTPPNSKPKVGEYIEFEEVK